MQDDKTIAVRPVTPVVGAEIDIDLAQPSGEESIAEIHRALMDWHVVFFRDQRIRPQQHVDFGERFGLLRMARNTAAGLLPMQALDVSLSIWDIIPISLALPQARILHGD